MTLALSLDALFVRTFGQVAWIAGVLTLILHVVLAFAVFADSQLLWKHLRRKTFLVGGAIWALATLIGGILTVGLYWLIHHSALRPENRPDSGGTGAA